MSQPARPAKLQKQGPATRCVINGHALGWFNCTPCAMAMGGDQGSINRVQLSGCDIRASTNDVVGGTTLSQCSELLRSRGVKIDLYVGSDVVSPFYLAVQIQSGRGAVAQGNTRALLDTRFRSTGTGVNHAVFIAGVRGGTKGDPDEALVYDPAADGRTSSWGKMALGPQWWPWFVVEKFVAALRPWGDNDPRVLGPGKVYCAIFPDTEPHVHLRYGGAKTSPFPDRVRVDQKELWVHSTPSYGTANRVVKLDRDDPYDAYQRVTKSGRLWLGSHNGDWWIPGAKVRNIGGTQ